MYYFLGDIILMACSPYYVPSDWLPCDGRVMLIQQNTSLFGVIGNCYGGDGKTTFALPRLDPPPGFAGVGYCIVASGVFPPRP